MTAPYVPATEQLVVEIYVRNLDRDARGDLARGEHACQWGSFA